MIRAGLGMFRTHGKRSSGALLVICALTFQARLVNGEDAPEVRHPVALDKLLDLLDKKVDEDLVVSLVDKDCVAFDVNAENVAELSKALPKRVLQSAMDCRKHAASVTTASERPAIVHGPTVNGQGILEFFWKEAGRLGGRFERTRSGEAAFKVERGGWPTCTAVARLDARGITISSCKAMFHDEVAAESFPWEGIRSFCRESAKYETFVVQGSKQLRAIKFDEKRKAEVFDATLRFAGASPGGSCQD